MENNSIDFVSYKKLSQDSDAFIFSNQFSPFFEIQLDSSFSNDSLDLNFYTAGSTDNPDSYNLVKSNKSELQNKLYKINVFSSNNIDKFYLVDESDKAMENNIVEENISEDALKFLMIFSNKPNIQKNNKDSILSFQNEEYSEFLLGKRRFEISSVRMEEPNIVDFERSYEQSNPIVYDFTSEVNNTTVVNEVKSEIINNMNETINKFEQNILKNTVNKLEIQNMETKIVQIFEEKLDQKESSIIKTIQEQNKKDLNRSIKDLLNS